MVVVTTTTMPTTGAPFYRMWIKFYKYSMLFLWFGIFHQNAANLIILLLVSLFISFQLFSSLYSSFSDVFVCRFFDFHLLQFISAQCLFSSEIINEKVISFERKKKTKTKNKAYIWSMFSIVRHFQSGLCQFIIDTIHFDPNFNNSFYCVIRTRFCSYFRKWKLKENG